MFLWTGSSFQLLWDMNGESTSRRAGAPTPYEEKKVPEWCSFMCKLQHSGYFPPEDKRRTASNIYTLVFMRLYSVFLRMPLYLLFKYMC